MKNKQKKLERKMQIKLKDNERIDDLECKGLKIIQNIKNERY